MTGTEFPSGAAALIQDTSAIVAIRCDEPDAERSVEARGRAIGRLVLAGSCLETAPASDANTTRC